MVKNETIVAVDRAFQVLDLLYQQQEEMGVTEIAAALKLQKSTVFRLLTTMREHGVVYQNMENANYGLGFKLYALGMAAGSRITLKNTLHPIAQELAQRFNEVVHVSVTDHDAQNIPSHIILLKIDKKGSFLRYTPSVGSSGPSHCSAGGKCLMAFTPDSSLQKFPRGPLPALTAKTITNWDDLLKELQTVRQHGYAVDDEEAEIGLTCVGAPITGPDHKVVAAISISGPTGRMRGEDWPRIVQELQAAATLASNLLKD